MWIDAMSDTATDSPLNYKGPLGEQRRAHNRREECVFHLAIIAARVQTQHSSPPQTQTVERHTKIPHSCLPPRSVFSLKSYLRWIDKHKGPKSLASLPTSASPCWFESCRTFLKLAFVCLEVMLSAKCVCVCVSNKMHSLKLAVP